MLFRSEKEITKEITTADNVMRERAKEEHETGVENAKKQMGSVSIDALLSMGASIVED